MWTATLNGILASDPTHSIVSVLLDATCKGTVLILLAVVATFCMRRKSASARHLVWSTAMLGLLALPALSIALPTWRVLPSRMAMLAEPAAKDRDVAGERSPAAGVLSAASSSTDETADAVPAAGHMDHRGPRLGSGPAEATRTDAPHATATRPETGFHPSVHTTAIPWQAWVLCVWIGGVLLALLPIGLGMLSLWRLQWSAKRITCDEWARRMTRSATKLGVNRRVTLLFSNRRSMPMHWGILRPKLLLPADAQQWSEDRKRVVLLHELAHVKRWDSLTQTVGQLACALHWFNPLAWMALCKMRSHREAACDDLTLASGCKPSDYAEHLLQIASGLEASVLAAYGGLAMARRSQLEGRLLAILDPLRNRRAVSRVGVLLAILLAVAVLVPLAIIGARPSFQAVSSPGGSSGPDGSLAIRLIAVRPDGGDELFDPEGKPIGREPDYGGEPAIWNDQEMSRAFIFGWPQADSPVHWIQPVTVRPSHGEHGFGLGQLQVTDRPGNMQRGVLSVSMRRKFRDGFGFDVPVTRVDLTLRYYLGPRGPADCRFSGPFEVGQTVAADAQTGYSLTIKPPETLAGHTTSIFMLHADRHLHFGVPLIAYDTAGRWHLAVYNGGSLSSDESNLKYRLKGISLEHIVAVTFNERPREKTFRNVVVDYPGLQARSHAPYLDELAARLGIPNPGPQKMQNYSFKSVDEAVECIDLVRGYGIDQAWQAIGMAPRPRITPEQLDQQQLQRLRAAATTWLTAGKPRARMHGIQLGLWGRWAEFFPPALAMVRSEEYERGDVAMAIDRYSRYLTAEQVEQVKRVLLSRDDPPTHRVLFDCLRGLPESRAKNDALLDLAQSDKVWLWWPAMNPLAWPRDDGWERLLALAAESPEIRRRILLALGSNHLPNTPQEVIDEAHAALPALLTPALLRINGSLFADVIQAMAEHVDEPTATAALVRFLKQLLDQWELSDIHGRANMNYWAVDRSVRYLNSWHDLSIGGLTGDPPSYIENPQKTDWKAIAAEAIEACGSLKQEPAVD